MEVRRYDFTCLGVNVNPSRESVTYLVNPSRNSFLKYWVIAPNQIMNIVKTVFLLIKMLKTRVEFQKLINKTKKIIFSVTDSRTPLGQSSLDYQFTLIISKLPMQ
jgi:hypothetical protein